MDLRRNSRVHFTGRLDGQPCLGLARDSDQKRVRLADALCREVCSHGTDVDFGLRGAPLAAAVASQYFLTRTDAT
jgi:hypothetical protein